MPMAAVPTEVVLGVIVHLFNSALFGIVFALIAPLLFVDECGPSQVLELIVHPLAYGLVLVPFFLSVVDRRAARAD